MENIIKTEEEKLGQLIYPVGFWRTKAKYIKAVCLELRDKYGGNIPGSVKESCKLRGVGPKMVHLAMSAAWGEQEGIGVDSHVHRICARLAWTPDCVELCGDCGTESVRRHERKGDSCPSLISSSRGGRRWLSPT